MEGKEVLGKLINEVVTGISETEDKKILNRYQRILDYLNMLLGGREKWK